ncbi:protein MpCYP829-like25 [Marchantia polymorpha subsp. ruderalis]
MAESTSGSEQSFRTWPVPELESLSLRATMVGLQADEVDALQFRSWLGRHNLDIVAACAALLLTLIVRRFFRSERLRLAPGPRKWPVIGNLPSVMGTTPAHLNFLRLAAEYGPIVRLELGAVQILVISSAELAKEILETQDHIFASRPSNIKAEVAFFGRDLLFAPLGDRFRLMRKVLAVELLGPKRIQQFRESRRQEVLYTVNRIIEEGHGGRELIVEELLQESAFCVLTRMIFNRTFYSTEQYEKEEENQMKNIHKLFSALTAMKTSGIGDSFPSLRKFDLDGFEGQLTKIRVQLDTCLSKIIEQHRHRAAARADPRAESSDFLDVLLCLQTDASHEAHGFPDDDIKALLLDILLAGTDATRLLVVWAMCNLMKHPHVMKKVQQELDDVVGRERLVDESDMKNLAYLGAVARETLRLHPGSPVTVAHVCTKDTQVGGYDVRQNTSAFVNLYALHRDPKLWDNPLEFRPERWLHGELDHKRKEFAYLPFGAGRRMCPGMNLGSLVAHFTLAQLMHTCNFSLPVGMKPDDISLAEKFGVVLSMAHPLKLLVSPRLPPTAYTEQAPLQARKQCS